MTQMRDHVIIKCDNCGYNNILITDSIKADREAKLLSALESMGKDIMEYRRKIAALTIMVEDIKRHIEPSTNGLGVFLRDRIALFEEQAARKAVGGG